jgi:hypothetical protein
MMVGEDHDEGPFVPDEEGRRSVAQSLRGFGQVKADPAHHFQGLVMPCLVFQMG